MKKALVMLLVLAMLVPMLLVMPASAEAATPDKPFYTLGWSEFDEKSYPYLDGLYQINWSALGGSVKLNNVTYGSADFDAQVLKLAQTLKTAMDKRPAGARYIHTFGPAKVYRMAPENGIFMDYAVDQMVVIMDALMKKYKEIGGQIDGIVVDVEFTGTSCYYLFDSPSNEYQNNTLVSNPDLLRDIVKDKRYKTEIRPLLEEWGFIFYDAGDPVKQASYTELFSVTKNAGSKYARSRNVWNTVSRIHLNQYVTKWAYDTAVKYFPDINVNDYQSTDTATWLKMSATTDDGTEMNGGNSIKAGNTSTYSWYYGQPNANMYDGIKTYTGYNGAYLPKEPFTQLLYYVNFGRYIYESTDTHKIAPWITYYDYGDTDASEAHLISNTPYYTEQLYHLGMLDPQPFLGYCYVGDGIFKDGRENSTHYKEIQQVMNEAMAELTRVAGYSDRKPLVSTMDWNSQYILSGMYTGGRNLWRITPNTNAITMGEFLVDKEVPTFYVDGKTVTFPGGKIIEDSTISIVGSSGYWVETAKDVVPVVTTEAEHYEFYPSFQYDFEEYASGAFDYNTSKPKNAWGFTWSAAGDVKGQSNILNIDGNNKLAIIGNSKNWVKELPTNVTAGDSFAEDQTWELTVTVPEGLSADAQIDILTYNGNKQDLTDGGFMIKGYKLYYATGKHDADGNPIYEEMMEVKGGSTYGFKRIMNFHHENAFYCTYAVTTGSGRTLKSVEQIPCPSFNYITQIGFGVTGADKAVYVDDFKVFLCGVTADFSVYDKRTGQDAEIGALRDRSTAYRLSWLNASGEDHTATIKADITEGGKTTTTTLHEVAIEPGKDGIITGFVDLKEGQTVKVYMETSVVTPVNPFEAPEEAGPLVDATFTEGGIKEVPDALKAAGLDTVEKIKAALEGKLLEADSNVEAFIHYTVEIKKEDIPKHGKMTVIMPYPEGTDANYTFYAAQLFTTDDYNKELGSVEIANVANTAGGIQFTVYGASPIAIGWIAPEEVEVDDGLIPMPPTDSRPAPTAVKVQRPTEAPETEETEEPTEETEYIEDTEPTEEPTEAPTETTAPAVVEDEGEVNIWLIVVIAVVVLAGAGAAVFFLLKKKKVAAPAAEEIEDIEESAEEKTEE